MWPVAPVFRLLFFPSGLSSAHKKPKKNGAAPVRPGRRSRRLSWRFVLSLSHTPRTPHHTARGIRAMTPLHPGTLSLRVSPHATITYQPHSPHDSTTPQRRSMRPRSHRTDRISIPSATREPLPGQTGRAALSCRRRRLRGRRAFASLRPPVICFYR